MDEVLLKRLHEFFSLDRNTIGEKFDPYLYRYFRKLFLKTREVDGFIRWCVHLANNFSSDTNENGGLLLDAGCGFGITSFGFAASTDLHLKIIGLDPSAGKIEVMGRIASFLDIDENRVKPVLGSALDLAFDGSTFDAVFVKDVASHVRDRPRFFSEISRVLKPSGKLLLTDENNSLDIFGRGERARIWRRTEYGPLLPDGWLERPYQDERRHLIAEWRPDLPAETVDALAEKSLGMWGDELKRAILDYSAGDEFINTADFPFRHPVSGEYVEYPFNPFKLAEELASYDLKARVIPPVFQTGHPLKQFAGAVISTFHPASIIIQPNFYILAEKLN